MDISPLPILNCDECGVCCLSMGTPPGYVRFLFPEFSADRVLAEYEVAIAAAPTKALQRTYAESRLEFLNEFERFELMPQEALELIRQNQDAAGRGVPCVWFDLENRRCRFYEDRPSACRDAVQAGDTFCRRWRRKYGVD